MNDYNNNNNNNNNNNDENKEINLNQQPSNKKEDIILEAKSPQNNENNRQSGDNQNNRQYQMNASNNSPNSYNMYNQNDNLPPNPPRKKSFAKKSSPAIAAVCAFCIVFSGLAGFGGVLLGNKYFSNNSSGGTNTNSNSYTQNDGSVIYKSVSVSTEGKNGGTVSTVAAAVSNSVVEITTEYKNVSSLFQYVSSGAGSGVIITSDGYIVTNNHVISNASTGAVADKVTVRLANGETYEATVIGTDKSTDLAVIKIVAENLSPAIFGSSDKLAVGEDVIAVGNPLGELGGTVTNGIISALDREISVEGTKMNLLQTNAAVNPGNSGGGLFNMNGELIGIVNAKSSGSGIEGLAFAIPSNDANKIVEQIINYGYVKGRVYLGLQLLDISDYNTAMYYRVNALGVYVMSAVEGYNDEVLKSGDRIVAINGTEIATKSDISTLLKEHEVNDKLTFSISRDGKVIDVEINCFESIPDSQKVAFNEQQGE